MAKECQGEGTGRGRQGETQAFAPDVEHLQALLARSLPSLLTAGRVHPAQLQLTLGRDAAHLRRIADSFDHSSIRHLLPIFRTAAQRHANIPGERSMSLTRNLLPGTIAVAAGVMVASMSTFAQLPSRPSTQTAAQSSEKPVIYLDQAWSPKDRAAYYWGSQGSALLPG
jgi:hypothetical protein